MPDEIRLRNYIAADLGRLLALDKACFDQEIAYGEGEMRAYLSHSGAICVVAEKGKEVAGFILLHRLKRATGHVITIDIAPAFRRHGLGRRLMQVGEEQLLEEGYRQVFLEVAVNNLGAITFYRGLGYQVLRTLPRYYPGALDGLLMGKRLD